jgi:hypothetical protein
VEYRPKFVDFESGIAEIPRGNYDPYVIFCIRSRIISVLQEWDPNYYPEFTTYQVELDRWYEVHMVMIVTHLNSPSTNRLEPTPLTENQLTHLDQLVNEIIADPYVVVFDPRINRGFPLVWAASLVNYITYRLLEINRNYDPNPENVFVKDSCICVRYRENYTDQNALLDSLVQALLTELHAQGAAIIDGETAERWNYTHLFDAIYVAAWKSRYLYPKNSIAYIAERLFLSEIPLTFRSPIELSYSVKHILSTKIKSSVMFEDDLLNISVSNYEEFKTIEDAIADPLPKKMMNIVLAEMYSEEVLDEKIQKVTAKISTSEMEITKYKNRGRLVLSISAFDDETAKRISELIK